MSSNRVVFHQEAQIYCCGVDELGGFIGSDYGASYQSSVVSRSGTGLFVAAFIDNDTNRRAYEQLTKEHRLLYQSPVKRNDNSGNQLFLCVFQYRTPRRQQQEKTA
jgi:hypothetical protein